MPEGKCVATTCVGATCGRPWSSWRQSDRPALAFGATAGRRYTEGILLPVGNPNAVSGFFTVPHAPAAERLKAIGHEVC